MSDTSICKTRILSEKYRDFIIGNILPPAFEGIGKEQLCEQPMVYGYTNVYVEEFLANPLELNKFYYNTIPNCYSLLDASAMNDAGIIAIQNFPTLQLKGEGVLIGFVDTGIDYTHPVFCQPSGNTRIEAIWDQTIQEGIPPEGFLYGTEYVREAINIALKSENPREVVPSTDEDGHGTYVASVAAGNAVIEEQFVGAAPQSSLAVVKLKGAKQYLRDFYYIKDDAIAYQENDIIFAIKYLKQLADKLNMPLVICLALGTNLGSHTGIAPLSDILNQYADVSSMVLVTGVGNEANERHHFLGRFNLAQRDIFKNVNLESQRGNLQEIEIRVGENVKGFVAELWTEIPNLLSISILSPSGEKIPPAPLRKGNNGEYHFTFEGTKVYIDYRLLMEKSNSELVFFRFTTPASGIWKVLVEPIQLVDGIYHMWVTGSDFLSGEVFFLESNPETTINEPANATFPITVSYYNGLQSGVDIQSGRGYTRGNVVKPDFTAPGVEVKGANLSGRFVKKTGSSAATAITAGASALLLEWMVYQLGEKNISSIQIKNLLILGTKRDDSMEFPNEEWGYGKLDLFNTFENIRKL